MEIHRRGRLPRREESARIEWEDALALCMHGDDLSELCLGLDALYLRFQQILHRHPERKELIGPALAQIEDMRHMLRAIADDLEKARASFLAWREKYVNGTDERRA